MTHVTDVEEVNEEMVMGWALQHSGAGVVLLGAGPPCQGVSGLNADRRGAQQDERSRLYVHVPRIKELVRQYFSWAQVHHLVEKWRLWMLLTARL